MRPAARTVVLQYTAGARVQRRARLAWTIAAVAMAGIGVLAVPQSGTSARHKSTVRKKRGRSSTPDEPYGRLRSPPTVSDWCFPPPSPARTSVLLDPAHLGVDQQLLPGTEGGTFPFWRPDSQAIGFFADNTKWIHAAGGPTTTLATVQHAWGGSWNQNGDILFSRHLTEELWRVSSSSGSEPVQVTRFPPSSQSGHVYPWFLPDGRHFLYWATGNTEGAWGIWRRSMRPKAGA